ncbi:hypothetical protein JXB01_03910 [Candidatus Micrarchaeota archaeon]|nr:hypothetical protein [Candidatus Micrarchaeota archaeon]
MKKLIFLLVITAISAVYPYEIGMPWEHPYWDLENEYVITAGLYGFWYDQIMDESVVGLACEEIDFFIVEDEGLQSRIDECILYEAYLSEARNSCGMATFGTVKKTLTEDEKYYFFLQKVSRQFVYPGEQVMESVYVSECLKYGGIWKAALSNAVYMTAKTEIDLEDKVAGLKEIYEKIEYEGLCGQYAKEECEEYLELVNEKKNITGAHWYGKSRYLLNNLSGEFWEERPDMEHFSEYINIVWSNMSSVEKLKARMEVKEKDADEISEMLKKECEISKDECSKKLKQLEKEKVNLISALIESGGYLGETELGTLRDSYEELVGEKGTNDVVFELENFKRSKKIRGWLQSNLENYTILKEDYDLVSAEAESLLESAEDNVEEIKERAEESIDEYENIAKGKMESQMAEEEYGIALENMNRAEKSVSLGERFAYYKKAYTHAENAKLFLQEGSEIGDTEFLSKLERINGMIKSAEKDGLEVSVEKTLAENIEPQDIGRGWYLDFIEESILEKAESRFYGLPERKNEIIHLLSSGPGLEAYKKKFQGIDDGFVGANTVDYFSGLGKLADAEESYEEIIFQLKIKMDDIVVERLEKEVNFYVPEAEVEGESEVEIEISIRNRMNYGTGETSAEVEMPFETALFISDFDYVPEEIYQIATEKKKITIYFREINANSEYVLLGTKNGDVVEVNSVKTETWGKADGSAVMEKEFKFDILLDAESIGVYLPGWKCERAVLDGYETNCEGGRLGKKIDAGNHILNLRYYTENGWDLKYGNYSVSDFGMKKQVSHILGIVPNIDMDSVQVVLGETFEGNVGIKGIYSYSGNKISGKQYADGNTLFSVFDLKVGEETQVRIEYEIENAEEYLGEEYLKYSGFELTDSEEEQLESVGELIEQNKTNEALEILEGLKKNVEKRTDEDLKYGANAEELKKYVENEIEELREIYEKIDRDDVFAIKIKNRIQELEEINNSTNGKNNKETVDLLKKIDREWMQDTVGEFWKMKYSEYNSLKGQMISAGVNEIHLELFEDFEEKMNKMKVTGEMDYIPEIIELYGIIEQEKTMANVGATGLYNELVEEIKEKIEKNKDVEESYSLEYGRADGKRVEKLFSVKPSEISKSRENVEESIEKKENYRDLSGKYGEYLGNVGKMEKTNERIMDEYTRVRELSLKIYSEAELNEGQKDWVEQAVERMELMAGEGRYVEAIDIGETIVDDLSEGKVPGEENEAIWVIIVSLIALGAFGVYMLRDRIRFGEKKEKKWRKIKRMD